MLEDIADVIDPHPSHRAPAVDPEGIPFVGIGDVREDGVADFRKARLVSPKILLEHAERYSLDTNLIGLGRVASVGKVVKLPKGNTPYTISPTLAVISPTKIAFDYLYYALQSPQIQNQLNGLKQGSGRQSVGILKLRKVYVPVPPIGEQHKIINVLEDHLFRLDAALAVVKQIKIKATQFRRSLLQAAFTGNLGSSEGSFKSELPEGWELKRLSDCLEKLKSGKKAERGWSPQCLSHPSPNENVWGVLKTTSIQMGEFQPEYNKELPESLAAKSGLEVISGDFLVTTTGPRNRCGIVCHVKKTRKKLIFSGKILRFRVNESLILPDWLMYMLMSPEYQSTLDNMKVGTSESSVSIGNQQILDLKILVPPIDEQRKIVEVLEDHLSRLDMSVSMAEAMEKQSIGLRRSLLQAAFTGQLTNEVLSV
jgi:restriction endonuclease S subunit